MRRSHLTKRPPRSPRRDRRAHRRRDHVRPTSLVRPRGDTTTTLPTRSSLTHLRFFLLLQRARPGARRRSRGDDAPAQSPPPTRGRRPRRPHRHRHPHGYLRATHRQTRRSPPGPSRPKVRRVPRARLSPRDSPRAFASPRSPDPVAPAVVARACTRAAFSWRRNRRRGRTCSRATHRS